MRGDEPRLVLLVVEGRELVFLVNSTRLWTRDVERGYDGARGYMYGLSMSEP